MPGFNDKLQNAVLIGEKVQATLPTFEPIRRQFGNNRKVQKLVWSPEEDKIEELDILMNKLGEFLGSEVRNQARASKLLRENEYVIEKCLEAVSRQKTKYKIEFKGRKVTNKRYR